MVGCFGFNDPFRQYFSLYRDVSQREEEGGRKKRNDRWKKKYTNNSSPLPPSPSPPLPAGSAIGPFPTAIQTSSPALEVQPAPSHLLLPFGVDKSVVFGALLPLVEQYLVLRVQCSLRYCSNYCFWCSVVRCSAFTIAFGAVSLRYGNKYFWYSVIFLQH